MLLYLQVATHLDNHPKIILSLDKDFSENKAGIEQKFLPDFLLGLE
ncbi:MAG: hypothetical protein FWC26_01395 [Fibromonadales bacterium]|nr:hypothetical protein [Fibromonadales bacterium]